jgi:4-amino-4-deoxy-L-arabinose transferase-like glycosyltransferase
MSGAAITRNRSGSLQTGTWRRPLIPKAEEKRPGEPLSLRRFWILTLLVAVCGLPFLNQAFHIDDRIYLEIADNALRKPFFPYDYQPIAEGLTGPDAASGSNLPLTSYYIALVKLLFGSEREWVFHLAFMIFPLLAVLGFYELARSYTGYPMAAAALLLLSPAFFVVSHTLMKEVPLLAFWILGLAYFLRILDGRAQRRDWLICGAALLGAAFITLVSAGLVFLLAAALWLHRRDVSPAVRNRLLFLLAVPILLWGAWYLVAYLYYERFVLTYTALHMVKRSTFSWYQAGEKALSFLLNTGGIFLSPLAAWYAFSGRWRTRLAVLLFVASYMLFHFFIPGWTFVQVTLFALFFTTGVLVALEILELARSLPASPAGKSAVKDRDRAVLFLWYFGALFAALFVFYSGSVRYSMLALPPVILLWFVALERRVTYDYFLRNLVGLGVVLTGIYAVVIGYADYRFADGYRELAQGIHRDYGQPGRTIWVAGEWGFRHYMEAAGARPILRVETEPREGDIIVKPYVAMPWVTLYDSGDYSHLVEQRSIEYKIPVRLLDFGSKAGFYSTGWGLLPLGLGEEEKWEWVNVFQVKRQYDGPAPAEEKAW